MQRLGTIQVAGVLVTGGKWAKSATRSLAAPTVRLSDVNEGVVKVVGGAI
jgi:hypothetical protein